MSTNAPKRELIKMYLQALLKDSAQVNPCLRLNGTPRAAFDTFEEAEAFSLIDERYNEDDCRRAFTGREGGHRGQIPGTGSSGRYLLDGEFDGRRQPERHGVSL
jgi:hypothetical protein